MSKPKLELFLLAAELGSKLVGVLPELARAANLGKLGLAGASYAGYAIVFNWQFALVIMSMLLVHESGHVWAMRRLGVKTRGLYFIPFVGGAALAEHESNSWWDEAFIALMGPIFGLGITLATLLAFFITQNSVFAAAASCMALFNLLNLLPVSPLDGGKILKAIAASASSQAALVWVALLSALGIIGLGLLGIWLFALFGALGMFEVVRGIKDPSDKPKMRPEAMIGWALCTITTAGVLWLVMHVTALIPGANEAMRELRS